MEKYKTEWDLALLYKSDNDPQIEKDMQTIEKACADFEKKYRNKDFTSTPEKLRKALEDSEALSKKIMGHKPWWYFMLRSHMDSENSVAKAMVTQFEQRLTKSSNKITFFSLKVAAIPKKDQKKFLTNSLLKPFKYNLEHSFENAKYNLTEAEENMASLFSQTSYSMWVSAQEKSLFQQLIDFKGEKIPVSKARELLADLPKKDRHELYKKITDTLKFVSQFAEAEINAICNYKKVLDEKRGYKEPYSASVIGNENTEKEIELLASVVTKYFSISHRFYKLHAKLLKEKTITRADASAKIGEIKKKFNFPEMVKVINNAFEKVGPWYVDMFKKYLTQGQIDVYPRKGKYSGGYHWKTGSNPSFILLNHVDSIRSVETLGHEMGHAFHGELSQLQPPRYQDHPSSTAEVASTFFEQIVTDEIENILSDKEKIIMTHSKLARDIHTIFTQIACFNFETDLHKKIRGKGQLSKDEIAELMGKHLKAYTGPAMKINSDDGYIFVSWMHLRMFFYTYTYAYGHIISKAMYECWKKDRSFESKVREFLSAGSSMSPRDIFKKIGIDINDPKFFESGLKAIDADITKLEKLAKKNGLI